MNHSASNQDLLDLPAHSCPRILTEFSVDGIGGGYIVVNTYGDFVISVGTILIGELGKTWKGSDEAIDAVCFTADCYSEKCTATDIRIGGCAILLYFLDSIKICVASRRALLERLANELILLKNTYILCLPSDGITIDDLKYLYKVNEEIHDEMNPALEGNNSPISRSKFLTMASEGFEYPIPKALLTPLILETIPEHGAHSAYGATATLVEARKWERTHIFLVGLTSVSRHLYNLLEKEGYNVYISYKSDETDEKEFLETIETSRLIPWSEAPSYSCDIMILCTPTFPQLNPKFINSLNCKTILSLSDCVLPIDAVEREETHLAFESKGIFDFCDGLCDLGAVAKLYHMSQHSNFKLNDAFKMGAKIMRKSLHLKKIVEDYDQGEKHAFYRMTLNRMDESTREHLNLGLGTIIHNSSERMTEWMWSKAKGMCPALRALQRQKASTAYYLDLGAGIGNCARWICKQDPRIHVKCIDANPKQNAENRQHSDEAGLGGQISVETQTFELLPSEYSHAFDGVIAQDSFVHAFTKLKAYSEAFKVTKGGGWILVSDIMRGNEVNDADLRSFAEENKIKSWFSPSKCVDLAEQAGWVDVQFIDCTEEIKVSLKFLLEQYKSLISSGRFKGLDFKLLQAQRFSLLNRIGQLDRGVFKWGIIAGRKAYDVVFMSEPPVVPRENSMMNYSINLLDGDLTFGTNVVILNISDRMPRESIMRLPTTVRLIVTMSAGLDHICVEAAKERGIRVRRAARDQIVKSVADYLLCNIIFGLRNGYQNIGVPFPGKSWNLSWNADGVDLDCSKIGFVGMGAIGIETARRIRALSSSCEMVYNIPKGVRCHFKEGTYRMNHVGIADLYSTCDVIIPMVPLTPATTYLVKYSSFSMMKSKALFINMARGKVVSTGDLTRALKENLIRHAILDTTDPEPLPTDHELWSLPNCTITPHFATNTEYVREELVEDIPNQVEDTLEERGILRIEEQELRKELSEAYHITREFGMDELVWNHISGKLSDGSFLITPGKRMFDDIAPQDLLKSSGNVTADVIHDAIYKARPDVKAIVHLHTPAAVAISCLEIGFVPLAQEAAPFYNRVASYPWQGISDDIAEQKAIMATVADTKYNTLLMENHGFCCMGKTVGEAWVLAYYFEKACQTQLNCLQSGVKIRYPKGKVMEHAAKQSLLPDFLPGNCEWDALRKMLTRKYVRN